MWLASGLCGTLGRNPVGIEVLNLYVNQGRKDASKIRLLVYFLVRDKIGY
jgi:hypothetical protein